MLDTLDNDQTVSRLDLITTIQVLRSLYSFQGEGEMGTGGQDRVVLGSEDSRTCGQCISSLQSPYRQGALGCLVQILRGLVVW